mmetsp:Transcript_39977/g.61178  ORF Transcript_39977/g.61178 Transcript_39977/m.61178 type:complete len:289 (-) Transcript_39977:627-1493(-)
MTENTDSVRSDVKQQGFNYTQESPKKLMVATSSKTLATRVSNKTYHSDSNRKDPFIKKKARCYPHKCAFEHDQQFTKKKREAEAAMRKLLFVAIICFVFMICEIIGGLYSGSLAILTDAAHMFSDVTGFLISWAAVYISQRSSTVGRSMGNHRAEIIGAVAAILLIWGLLIVVDYEAYQRIVNPPPPIDAKMMLIIACLGLFFNLVNFFALEADCGKKGEDEDEEEEKSLADITLLGDSMVMDEEACGPVCLAGKRGVPDSAAKPFRDAESPLASNESPDILSEKNDN